VLETELDLERCAATLGFPVIVKPSAEGSSIGMSRAESPDALAAAWEHAAGFQCPVFAEQWITGAEYTAAILDSRPLPLIRLETPNAFYDFDAKYKADSTRYHCPCGLSPEVEEALQDLAVRACRTLEVSGWARVDLLVDQAGAPSLIEVNTVPGMTDHSLVPMAAKAAGIDFDDLVWRILETSL
jgi:D-alanine-D-alanine ligase